MGDWIYNTGRCLRTATNLLYRFDRDNLQSGSYYMRGWNKKWIKYNLSKFVNKK